MKRFGSQATLGVAMGLANVMSYAFVLLVTRLLGPAGFGAYSALNTLGIILVFPAGVLQIVVARRWQDPAQRTSAVGAAHLLGAGLTGLTMVASPAVQTLFHLDSPAPVIAMASMVYPMLLTGAYGGVLLGAERLGQLAMLYIVTAITRVAAALICVALGAGVTGVFLATAVASVLTAGYGRWACRGLLRQSGRDAALMREMLLGSSTLAAFTALTNVDVILARHFLDAHASGGYGLAATFGRALCWGTQFIALLVVPRVAHRRGTTWKAAGLVTALGVVATAVVAVNPRWFLVLAGGEQYQEFGRLMVACVGLGTLWALAQLVLISSMARVTGWLGGWTWCVVAAQLLVGWLWWHGSALQIVALAATASALIVIPALWHSRRQSVVSDPAEALPPSSPAQA